MAVNPNWTVEQQQAIRERDREVVVSAAAGSGKTAVLVQRVVSAALGSSGQPPVPLERMLVVTFTKAAASEMKERLEAGLLSEREELRNAAPPGADATSKLALLNRQLSALPLAQISTIDSFLTDIVRRYGYLEGIELGKVLSEDEAKLARHRIATEMLDAALDGSDSEVTGLALAWGGRDGLGAEDLSQVRSDSGLRNLVLKLSEFGKSLADPDRWFREYFEGRGLDPGNFNANHPLLQVLYQQLSAWIAETILYDEQTADSLADRFPGAVYLEIIRRRKRILERVNLEGGWDACATALQRLDDKQDDLFRKPGLLGFSSKNIDDQAVKDWLKNRNELLKANAKDWLEMFSVPWVEVAESENAARAHTEVLWRLVKQFDSLYSSYKTQRSVCDFSDLSCGAFKLLAAHNSDGQPVYDSDGRLLASTVAVEYRKRFLLVVVDEFQDTNPLQEALVDLVTSDAAVGSGQGRPVFIVGDVKQSIYSFRLAEPLLLARRNKRFAAGTGSGVSIKLAKNFRSREKILDAINFIFLGVMDENLGGEDYTENQLQPGLDYNQLFQSADAKPEQDIAATLHLVRRDAGEPGDNGGIDDDDEDSKNIVIYRQVASVLHGIQQQGQRIYDKSTGEARPVAWRDMVVLLRSGASGRWEDLRFVLESTGVPAYAPARSGFYERPEISDVISLMRVLDNPRDDIALAAALTGPAGGLSPLALLELSQSAVDDGCPASLWNKANAFLQSTGDSETRQRVASFLERYDHWRDCARLKPTPEMLWQLLQESAMLVAYSPAVNGGQRVENLMRLHNLACEVSSPNQQGLAWFLQYLEQSKRAKGDLGEAPMLGEGEDVVRVMTIHQSKGLEFPVVVVPNLEKGFNKQDLNADVLWHRDLGFGARHVEFEAAPPRRFNTLGRRLVKAAKLRDILAEELRILYVALTRARERLELVGFADDNLLERLAAGKPKSKANSWLDWIAPKFARAITTAWDAPDGKYAPTAENPWSLNLTTGGAVFDRAVVATNQLPVAKDVLERIKARLSWNYPHKALAQTGTKLSVTALAKHAGEDEQAVQYKALDGQGEPLAATTQPRFMATGNQVTAAEIGLGTHFVLAQLDYHNPPDVAELQTLCAGFVEQEKLLAETAKLIDLAALVRCSQDISQQFVSADSQIYPELPVGMQLAAGDPDVMAYYETSTAQSNLGVSDEFVFVQGAIDLLIVTGNQALVVDFKTDRNASPEVLRKRHCAQLELYCRCIAMMLPGSEVSWLVYGLDGAGAVGPLSVPLVSS